MVKNLVTVSLLGHCMWKCNCATHQNTLQTNGKSWWSSLPQFSILGRQWNQIGQLLSLLHKHSKSQLHRGTLWHLNNHNMLRRSIAHIRFLSCLFWFSLRHFRKWSRTSYFRFRMKPCKYFHSSYQSLDQSPNREQNFDLCTVPDLWCASSGQ